MVDAGIMQYDGFHKIAGFSGENGVKCRFLAIRWADRSYNLARKRASDIRPRRLSRQIMRKFEAMTTLPPANTAGSGHSFQIIQPNSVAQRILL